jgi:hypothetical protein
MRQGDYENEIAEKTRMATESEETRKEQVAKKIIEMCLYAFKSFMKV